MTRSHVKYKRHTVYAGRPSPWGNPFVIGRDGTRAEVIQKFKDSLKPELVERFRREVPKDAVLGCFCEDHEACHCDVWIEQF